MATLASASNSVPTICVGAVCLAYGASLLHAWPILPGTGTYNEHVMPIQLHYLKATDPSS